MTVSITHLLVLRQHSELAPLVRDRAPMQHQGVESPLPLLPCSALDLAQPYAAATVHWSLTERSRLHIPHSETLLAIDVQDSDPRTIGFLRGG